jgi:hypothetical protein
MYHEVMTLRTDRNYVQLTRSLPVTAAERYRACTVFARSEAGIVGSNPSQGMDV